MFIYIGYWTLNIYILLFVCSELGKGATSCGSKVRPRTFGCVALGSALLFIVRSRYIFCMVWCEQSASCFVWI